MAEEKLNIYQKLAKIRKGVEVVQKNKSGFNYKYVTDDELYAKITGAMDKYGVSLIPMIVPGTFKTDPYTYQKYNKKTDAWEPVYEFISTADMVFRWVNNDDPTECVDVTWALVGQQADASQALGSGLTYTQRYFVLKYFTVATPEDDPDNWRSKQRAAELEEDKMIAKAIIDELDEKVRVYLTDHADKTADVKALMTKYVKGSGDYTKITNSALATKLLDEFLTTFGK